MATKWKNWTARRPIKIACVILIPILMFNSLFGLVGLAELEYTSTTLLFSDLTKNIYFYDTYIGNALSWAQHMFWLQSEDNIRNMGCLEWRESEWSVYDGANYTYHDSEEIGAASDSSSESTPYYELLSTNLAGQQYFGSIPAKDIDTSRANQMINDAINQQLSDYHFAKARLEETPGLYYFITDGSRWISNVSSEPKAEFFRSKPVYYIAEAGKADENSRDSTGRRTYYYNYSSGYYGSNVSCYVAFSDAMVDWQNGVWKDAQQKLATQLTITACPAIAALLCVILLLIGAGKNYHSETDRIYFSAIDKPWLDLGLCTLAAYETFLFVAFDEMASAAWRYDNFNVLMLLCATLSALSTLPLLSWLISYTKYCKAGKWWRHTLTYVVLYNSLRWLKRFAKSLWAGSPLTLKVAALGCILFAFTALCVGMYPSVLMLFFALVVTALTVYGLLRYTRKLYLLEQGAIAASNGHYSAPIPVAGGELGSIADSINNISDGINTAIAERLKSERFKTELITNISHDIRTPLTSLITYTDLLKREGLDAEKAPEYLEVLIQKSARLKTLTDDLFEASKAASGNIEVHIDTLNLADFIRQILGEMDERLRGSGLEFRLNLPEHAPVLADGKLLWRVADNLLSNVMKYALTGSRVYIDIAREGETYRLDMKNISEHPLNVEPSELIERFKRGDAARSGEGSGLGLSIAQSFVLSQGGSFALSIDGDLFKASISLPVAQGDIHATI